VSSDVVAATMIGALAHCAVDFLFVRLALLSLLGGFLQIADGLFQIANALLNLAFGLLFQPFGLLFLAANQLADFFLDLAADVLGGAFDLILVWGSGHDHFLNGWLNGLLCASGSVRAPGKTTSRASYGQASSTPGPFGGGRRVT
jgi:hypothetical protein